MLWFEITACTVFAIHYFMLGALTGVFLNLMGVSRGVLFLKVRPSRENIWMLVVLLTIAWTVGLALWQGPLSLFALVGHTLSGISFWQKSPKAIRRWALAALPLWFTYSAISHSYPGMLIEVIALFSIFIGMYRFDLNRNSKLRRFSIIH